MRRREFLGLLGGAVTVPFARPLAARAQQPSRVIGFLNTQSPDGFTVQLRRFRQGLKETGSSRARTSRSNIAGPRTKMTVFRN